MCLKSNNHRSMVKCLDSLLAQSEIPTTPLSESPTTSASESPTSTISESPTTTKSELAINLEPEFSYNGPLIRQCSPPATSLMVATESTDLFLSSKISYITLPGYYFSDGGKARSSICLKGSRWSAQVRDLRRNRLTKYLFYRRIVFFSL